MRVPVGCASGIPQCTFSLSCKNGGRGHLLWLSAAVAPGLSSQSGIEAGRGSASSAFWQQESCEDLGRSLAPCMKGSYAITAFKTWPACCRLSLMDEQYLRASASEDCSPLYGTRRASDICAFFGACRRRLSFAPFQALQYEEEQMLPSVGPGLYSQRMHDDQCIF